MLPRLLAVAIAVVLAGGSVAAFTVREDEGLPPREPVEVGTGPERESHLVAAVLVELLRGADVPAVVREFGRSVDARQALELGEVDVLPSYTGAVWLEEFGWANPPRDPAVSFERVRDRDARDGLVWLGPTGVNATFAFVAARPPAVAATMDDLGDLAALNTRPDTSLCVEEEFAGRADGLGEVARLYGIVDAALHDQLRLVDPDDVPEAVRGGVCVAGLTTATDGAAWRAGLRPVGDSLRAFPAFVLAPVVTEAVATGQPEVVAALEPFAATTTELLAAWNGEALREPARVVASRAAAALRAGA